LFWKILNVRVILQVTNVFLKRHSNLEIQLFGLKLCPLFQNIEEPNQEDHDGGGDDDADNGSDDADNSEDHNDNDGGGDDTERA